MKENIIAKVLNIVDGFIKFPNLKKGEIGIQVGFDLSSPNLTTDLVKMHYRVGNAGCVIGIDPDPFNHNKIKPVIEKRKLNIKLVQKATFSKTTTSKLTLGYSSSHNIIDLIDANSSPVYSTNIIEVETDTLDNIIEGMNIDWTKISHVSITNNGAEYETLKGMDKLLASCKNLSLTIASGRPGKIGKIGDKKDYEVIISFLKEKGFKCRFMRINQSFWWGVIHQLLIKRKWIFGQKKFGVVMAAKGNKKIKFYQSFS